MFILKSATPDDATTIATLHVAGWHGAYGGIVDAEHLANFSVPTWTEKWQKILQDDTCRILLAHDNKGHPAGFCHYGRLLTPPPGQSNIRPQYTAEIFALYLTPDFYRQGLGRQLIRHAAQDLIAQRHQGLALWVLAQNTRACSFYSAMGGQRIGSKDAQIGSKSYKEVCYGWRDMRRYFT